MTSSPSRSTHRPPRRAPWTALVTLRRLGALAVLVVALLPTVGLAAEASDLKARAFALEGKKAFDTGDYALAVTKYQEAYRLKSAPGLLFNLAQSYRKLGDLDEALSFYRRYLESNPPEAQARATELVITQVEAERVEKAAEAQRRLDAEREGRRLKLEETRLELARTEAAAAARRLELEQSLKAQTAPPPVTERWWFWAGLGAVVVAGAVTATVLATAPRPVMTTFPDINTR
jgi:tetratricopeptide (TPR) repeat protein